MINGVMWVTDDDGKEYELKDVNIPEGLSVGDTITVRFCNDEGNEKGIEDMEVYFKSWLYNDEEEKTESQWTLYIGCAK